MRLISLARASWGFETAEKRLAEMTGLEVSSKTIQKVSCEVGVEINRWTRESPELHEQFAQTPGETEFTTDGVSVLTTTGWREVKVSEFVKRLPTEARTAENLESLNRPKMHLGVAKIVKCEHLSARAFIFLL